jgi:hypothetical protein
MRKKSTSVELVKELTDRNTTGKYTYLITRCRQFYYHDVLKPANVMDPKRFLLEDLARFPELADIAALVLIGDYDERQNWKDIEDLDITIIN